MDVESAFEWLLKGKIWHLLIVSEFFTHGECLESVVLNALILCVDIAQQSVDFSANLSNIKNFQLLTPLKQFTGELLRDEHNADGLCWLIEHGKTKILLLLSLLTHLKVFLRELQQMMQFGFLLKHLGHRHMH
jgi:hypothetical protein